MLASVRDEMIVIGFAIDKKEYLDRFIAEVTEDHFTEADTNAMYNGIMKIVDAGGTVTPKLLAETVHNQDIVREAWLLKNKVPGADESFKTVHLCYQRRAYRKMAETLMELTYTEEFNPADAERMMMEYAPGCTAEGSKKHFIEMDEAVSIALSELIEAMKSPGEIKGVSLAYEAVKGAAKVGFKSLDKTMMGLKGGDLIMFAAKSGHGKTALAMNLARIMSYHNGLRVHYLNTEMDEGQMMRRWIAQSTMVPYTRLELGDIQPYELEKVEAWAEEFRKAPLTISQISSLTIDLTVGLAKRAIKKYGKLDCLIVDYIGRMDIEYAKGMQEYQMMYENTKRLKETARSLNIPIIALAQLNDEGKLEGAKKMRNELDGLFYFRPKVIKTKGEDGKEIETLSETEYYITKEKVRRNGTNEVIRVDFEKEYQFIREVGV